MICQSCHNVEATYTVWSVAWFNAADGVIAVCKNCVGTYYKVLIGEEAVKKFESIKRFTNYRSESFNEFRNKLIQEGCLMKGEKETHDTLLSRMFIEYEKDYWVVTRYSIANCGTDFSFLRYI